MAIKVMRDDTYCAHARSDLNDRRQHSGILSKKIEQEYREIQVQSGIRTCNNSCEA